MVFITSNQNQQLYSMYAVCPFSQSQLFCEVAPETSLVLALTGLYTDQRDKKKTIWILCSRFFGFLSNENRRQKEAGQIRKHSQSSSSEMSLAQGQEVGKTGLSLLPYLLNDYLWIRAVRDEWTETERRQLDT